MQRALRIFEKVKEVGRGRDGEEPEQLLQGAGPDRVHSQTPEKGVHTLFLV